MNVAGVSAEDEHGGLVDDGAVVIPTKIDNSISQSAVKKAKHAYLLL